MIAYGKNYVKKLIEENQNIIKNVFLVYENDVIIAICDTNAEALGLCSALDKKSTSTHTFQWNPS